MVHFEQQKTAERGRGRMGLCSAWHSLAPAKPSHRRGRSSAPAVDRASSTSLLQKVPGVDARFMGSYRRARVRPHSTEGPGRCGVGWATRACQPLSLPPSTTHSVPADREAGQEGAGGGPQVAQPHGEVACPLAGFTQLIFRAYGCQAGPGPEALQAPLSDRTQKPHKYQEPCGLVQASTVLGAAEPGTTGGPHARSKCHGTSRKMSKQGITWSGLCS